MIDTPASFLAMAGTAFVLASYAPTALESKSALPRDRVPVAASATGKGDRLSPPRPTTRERASVSVVEIVGLSAATVILRDRDGTILYRSDPLSNTTLVAKGADLPMVTLKDAPSSPTVQQSPSDPSSVQGLSPKQDGMQAPNGGERRSRPIGCETAVSPLVRGDVQREPGRCLAQIETPSAS